VIILFLVVRRMCCNGWDRYSKVVYVRSLCCLLPEFHVLCSSSSCVV
jgi:hypothetical protein